MTDLRAILAVAGGAAIGGVLRLCAMEIVVARAGATSGYLATFAVNASGSFLMGVVTEAALTRGNFNPLWRLFLATGILGGYTTFSTFACETWTLATSDALPAAFGYAAASVLTGIFGVFGGIALVRALSS